MNRIRDLRIFRINLWSGRISARIGSAKEMRMPEEGLEPPTRGL